MNKVSVVDCNNAEEEGGSLDTRYLKTASLIYLVLPFLFYSESTSICNRKFCARVVLLLFIHICNQIKSQAM